jgi:hypothetical protein
VQGNYLPSQELLEPRSAGFSVSGEGPNVAALGRTDCLIGTSVSVKGCKMPALNRRPVSLLEAQRAGV